MIIRPLVCYNENDFKITEKYVETFVEIISSRNIRNKVVDKYGKEPNIQIDFDNSITTITLICDEYTNEECVDALNMILKNSANQISIITTFNASVIDEANIRESTS